jgi:alpha-galactosidase
MLGVVCACALVLALPASSAAAALAATPYMGWNTFYDEEPFDQKSIIEIADSLIQRGLKEAGYRIVWLDAGWASGARDSHGNIIVSSSQWPKGLPWLTHWLHEHGLLAGIYTDAGRTGNQGHGLGSFGHFHQDANAFAAWGFDAVKVDFVGAGQEGFPPRPLYRRFAYALHHNSRGRQMILNVCNFWNPGEIGQGRPTLRNSSWMTATWARSIAQSWRTNSDVGVPGHITFAGVVRNLARNDFHPGAAGPGHWNDPDYLGPQLGMTRAEAQAQLSMWAVVAAPLIIGSDPRKLSHATVAMLENRRVIAIDQDRLGIQGVRIREEGAGQVWVKRLSGGARALALLNTGPNWTRITTSAAAIGMRHASRLELVNQWSGSTFSTRGQISVDVPPHSANLYRVTAL